MIRGKGRVKEESGGDLGGKGRGIQERKEQSRSKEEEGRIKG